jgi:hypothetical protein
MAKKKKKPAVVVEPTASPAEVRRHLDEVLRHVQQENKDAKVVSPRLAAALKAAGDANDLGAVEGLAPALEELQSAWDAEPDEPEPEEG